MNTTSDSSPKSIQAAEEFHVSPEEWNDFEESFEALRQQRRTQKASKQFSSSDPPNRDRATSQPAKAKDGAAAAAPAISAEIRRRLDKL